MLPTWTADVLEVVVTGVRSKLPSRVVLVGWVSVVLQFEVFWKAIDRQWIGLSANHSTRTDRVWHTDHQRDTYGTCRGWGHCPPAYWYQSHYLSTWSRYDLSAILTQSCQSVHLPRTRLVQPLSRSLECKHASAVFQAVWRPNSSSQLAVWLS